MRRVVITGIGAVTPLACGAENTWKKLLNGESGINTIDSFDTTLHPTKIAGNVPLGFYEDGGFDAGQWVNVKDVKKMDKFILLALAAATEAVEDSGWKPTDEEELCNTGVIIGSGVGGMQGIAQGSLTLEQKGPKRLSPFFIPANLINLASGWVSMKYGFKGPNHSVVTACATGTHAIGDGARMIQFGDADVMVAGGTDASICSMGIAGFNAAKALSTAYNDSPQTASRPWDSGRDGFVMGEGAGVVVLEEYEHAKARGAKIYAEVCGYGMSGDAYHLTAPAPDGNGGYRAMKSALRNAGIAAEDVDYINAHGTSTPMGDMIELEAVKRLMGQNIYNSNFAMSSTKSSIGHLLGAAGAVEAIFSAKAIQQGIAPATLNLDSPSEGADFNLVAHTPQEREITVALSNSFGFGGTNASLVFRKVT